MTSWSSSEELLRLALASYQAGQAAAAEQGFAEVIRREPSHASAHRLLGTMYYQQRKYAQAIPLLEKACQLDPRVPIAYYSLGSAHSWNGSPESAIAAFDRALVLDPGLHRARFARTMAYLPKIYAEPSEIDRWRSRYSDSLTGLVDFYANAADEVRRSAADAVGSNQPYWLPYQAGDDLRLQQQHGQLICSLIASRYPQFADSPPMPPIGPSERLRLGVLSLFFNLHSNWKMPIRGWIENIDHRRFQLFGYYTGNQFDSCTEAAQAACDDFVHGLSTVEDWANRIRGDALHVLIIPGLAMDHLTGKLSTLRLAPIQCNAVGHPVTSGLPTMDYYLSCEFMEPSNGGDHYSETLVRLPNIGVHYVPQPCETRPLDRAAFGIRSDALVYNCCQSLYKYLPRYDDIFPRIARSVPAAQFVFIRHRTQSLNEVFGNRLERVFRSAGMNSAEHCVFVPRLSSEDFSALMAQSDVFLDTAEWNGMNTVMEALPFDIPIVTLPGEFMRGRHALGILHMMGVTQTVARSLDEYVDLAVRLGRDEGWRREIAEQISRCKEKVYADMSSVRGLEAFLTSAVREGHWR